MKCNFSSLDPDPALVLALVADVTAADPATVAAAASLLPARKAATSPGAGPGEAAGPGPGLKWTRDRRP